MARSPRAASKTRGTGKAPARGASKRTSSSTARATKRSAGSGGAGKARGGSKRAATKVQSRRQQPQMTGGASSVGSLSSTEVGRTILVEVLEAAAAVLRRARGAGQTVGAAATDIAETGADLASTAVDVAADVASGAAEASTDIATAAADMEQTAVGTLTTMATDTVTSLLPEAPADTTLDEGDEHGGSRRVLAPEEEGVPS